MAEIVCPECHTRFRSARDLVGESVSCARCRAVFVVEPAGEEPDETPLPPGRTPLPRVTEKKKTKKSAGKKKGRRAGRGLVVPRWLVLVVGVGLLAVVAWMSVPGLSDAIRKGPGAVLSRVGVGDTAESLNSEVKGVYAELSEVLSEVKDEKSSEAAVPKVKQLYDRAVDIQMRALSAPTITQEELKEILKEKKQWAERQAAQQELDRVAAAKLATRELSDEVANLVLLQLPFTEGAASLGLVVPEATNEYEKIERERVLIMRRVRAAVVTAKDAAAEERAAKVADTGTGELKALAERREAAGGSRADIQAAEARFAQARGSAGASPFDPTVSLTAIVRRSEVLERAVREFLEADRKLSVVSAATFSPLAR